jgi:lysozyme family protein
MADVSQFIPKIFPWETGVTIDKASLVKMVKINADPGGWTKFGITLATWQTIGYDKGGDGDIDKDDLAVITVEDYHHVIKSFFWKKWQADLIQNQSIAEILVDWFWASGYYGIREPQKLLGVKPDGVVGIKTITAINSADQADLHYRIYMARMQFIERIVLHSIKMYLQDVNVDARHEELRTETLLAFKQGWINRIEKLYKTFIP